MNADHEHRHCVPGQCEEDYPDCPICGEPIDYCPGHGDLSTESLQEASTHINGEIDRILPLLEEQIAGAYSHEPVTLSVGDARLLVAVLQAERGMEKALGLEKEI